MRKLFRGQELVFLDEAHINATRRKVYVDRIKRALERIRVIDGRDALQLATDLVESFDFALENHLAEWSRVELKPHLGVGTREFLRVRGRIAERSNVALPSPEDEAFDILVSCWYRFRIHAQAPTPILVKRGQAEVLTSTDEEGFFDTMISAQPELGDPDYVVDVVIGDQATIRAEGVTSRSLVPHSKSPRCAIVDLDGLLLNHPVSRYTQVLGELVLGEFQRRRRPVDGLGTYLHRLAEGNPYPCPIFYVSHAPRHLYKHLEAAIQYAGLPEGYLHLRDYDMRLRSMPTPPANILEMLMAHELLEMFPEQRFVAVGSRRRADSYSPLIKAMAHRLDCLMLVGSEGPPEDLTSLCRELDLDMICDLPPALQRYLVNLEWARE
ncbi:DUF2183 domain-containing protein [Microvenator marinus]|uniref:DUF2183 domain-containing protein n=1 Tax=Microvenator marinus TaxID=2600177 RepID=A0A5B8XQB3_9DELT|nr:phosphatase domain-containing protein [Microvenator marinus]QED27704.1 DUF2183 domain-containing protein [Microvenator marinus]